MADVILCEVDDGINDCVGKVHALYGVINVVLYEKIALLDRGRVLHKSDIRRLVAAAEADAAGPVVSFMHPVDDELGLKEPIRCTMHDVLN